MEEQTMGLFNPVREGSWWLRSKSDPRWNADGRTGVGGFVMPKECEEKLEELKRELGEPFQKHRSHKDRPMSPIF